MRITPMDIQQKSFPVKWRGFDMEEVLAFLDIVKEQMEDLVRENASLKEIKAEIDSQLKEYRNMESTLRETLTAAQEMVENYKANAKKEAELIIKEAEIKAAAMIEEAQAKVIKIHEDITDLKGIKRHFKEELRRLIESHMHMIEFDDKEREEAEEV